MSGQQTIDLYRTDVVSHVQIVGKAAVVPVRGGSPAAPVPGVTA